MSEENDGPQNRRARRAAAKASGKQIEPPTSTPKLKLNQPDYSKPKEKTLLDLYNDKKELLEKGQPFNLQHSDGLARDEDGKTLHPRLDDDEVFGPGSEALFWSISLGMLHFTLDVLTQNQYRQEVDWRSLIWRTLTMLPILWLLLYMLRSNSFKRWWLTRQLLFLAVAVGAGCYTIRVANKYSYYAVMKQAPPLGTLWIWSVIEMDLHFAAISLLVDGGYLWLNGFSMY